MMPSNVGPKLGLMLGMLSSKLGVPLVGRAVQQACRDAGVCRRPTSIGAVDSCSETKAKLTTAAADACELQAATYNDRGTKQFHAARFTVSTVAADVCMQAAAYDPGMLAPMLFGDGHATHTYVQDAEALAAPGEQLSWWQLMVGPLSS
jgi:hypothetical protein